MKRIFLTAIAITTLACRGEAQQQAASVATPNDPLLKHYEIRADQLPAPYATKSSGNPPNVTSRPSGAFLHVPPGFHITAYASNFEDPRNMVLAPNGDIFVAETAAGRISILRGEHRFTFATELNEPFGLAFHGDFLYVGDTDAIVRFDYKAGQTAANAQPQRLAPLPTGGHSTRNVIFNRDGTKMYVAVGSASNVSPEEPIRAAILEFNPDGTGRRVFAGGLRNPVGLAWQPGTNSLWTAVNERDGLGDDLVPDYMTEVRDGAFYGWPYTYIGQHEDPRRRGERPDLVAKAVVPSVLMQAHSAALGLTFYDGTMFPAQYRGAAIAAMHGSWNRSQRTGYKIVSVPFRNGKPAGGYDDLVVGWAPDANARQVWGRPVGVLVLRDGSLLIADDGAGVLWRLTYQR
jgi:glucose/arabinose dehydrogenase